MDSSFNQVFLEKGFWAALGFLGTLFLTTVGIAVRNETTFRSAVSKKFARVHEKIDDHRQHVAENYVDKSDMDRLIDRIENGFSEIKKEIRDVRNGKS